MTRKPIQEFRFFLDESMSGGVGGVRKNELLPILVFDANVLDALVIQPAAQSSNVDANVMHYILYSCAAD